MKPISRVMPLAGCALVIFATQAVHLTAQNTAVSWSAFDMGFASSTAANTTVESVAGQALVGTSQQDNNLVSSGFLAYPFPMHVKVRIFLEGPFNVSAMRKILNTSGILASHFTAVPIPTDAVDSISIEIRNFASAAASTIRRFRPAWLLTDGTIRDILDTVKTSLQFDPPVGSYYVVAKHRNHLAIMTATGQSLGLDPPASAYDFTTGLPQYYGGEAKNLGAGKYGMFAGDYSADGFIDASDFVGPDNDIFLSGYRQSDHNMDGFVDASDFVMPDNNVFKGTKVP